MKADNMVKKMILIIIGIIIFIWFLLPVISGRIMNIGSVTGMGIGIILFLYGLFFVQVNHFISWFWQRWYGKTIEIIIGLAILVILILAAMTTISMASAAGKKEQPDATVIVLGCKINSDRPSLMLTERLEAAYGYLMEYPDSYAIVSGGQGENEITAEADVMYEWLIKNGIESERVIKEDRSTDTHENLKFSHDIIMEDQNGRLSTNIVIATNEFHEYRALRIAEKLGFDATPLSAKTAWWLLPTYYIREMYGILEDWFLVR